MKLKVKLIVVALLLICIAYAQSTAGFNYQAVVRNSSGEILANQRVSFRMSLIQGSANGSSVYRETFTKTTNSFGLINLVIGTGTVSAGSFSTIDWGAGPYFLETAIDNNGGTTYTVLGTSQLMSVPFALYSESSASDGVDGTDGASAYQIWLDEGNTGTESDFLASLVGEGGAYQDISLSGAELSISDGSTVDLSTIDTDTNTQLSEDEVDAFVSNNGYITAETQDLSLSGSSLSISGGSSVDLSSLTNFTDTNTQLSETEVDDYVANNGYLTSFTEVDGDATNEIQDLSLSGTELSISEGSTIDLSGIYTDTNTQLSEVEVDGFVANNGYLTTEAQDLSLSGNDLSITGGSSVDLSSLANFTDTNTQLSETEVDDFVANNGFLTSFSEVDGDATNELQTLTLSEPGLLTISDGNSVQLTDISTFNEIQSLAYESNTLTLNNSLGFPTYTVDLSDLTNDADADPANEIQILSINDNEVSLSNGGGSIILPSNPDFSTTNELNTSVELNGTDLETTDAGGTIVTDLSSLAITTEQASAITNNTNQVDALSLQLININDESAAWQMAAEIVDMGSSNWDEAYSWGNHADEGFLTVETQSLSDVLTVNNDASGQTISNLPDPLADQDAATKAYVDALENIVSTLSNQINVLATKVAILEGESLRNLLDGGLSARELLDAGYTVDDLLNAPHNITTQELLDGEITPLEILNAEADLVVAIDDLYGLTYEGGFIVFVDESNGSGLIAAPTDQSTTGTWGCMNTFVFGADGILYGTGYDNTQNILSSCSEVGIAARLCDDLVVDEYDDWFLPSQVELIHMLNNINAPSDNEYLSSTQVNASAVRGINGLTGIGSIDNQKDVPATVRAVRYFGSSIELLTEAGETLQEILDGGITPLQIYDNDNSTLAELYGLTFDGETIDNQQLIQSGIEPSIIYAAGLATYTELNTAGATYQQLFDIGANIDELEGFGAGINDFFGVPISASDLFANDPVAYSYANLYTAGYGIDELEAANADISTLLGAGVTPGDLFANDPTAYSYPNLSAEGVAFAELYSIGASIDELEGFGAQIADLVNIVPHFTLYTHDSEYTPNTIFDALSGDTSTKINAMLSNSSPFELYYLVVWNVATVAELYTAGVSVNEMVTDPNIYQAGAVTLNEINDNTAGTAEDFLANSSTVTHQQLLDLTSPFTLSEIYVAEDALDGTAADLSYDVSNLYGLTYKSGLVFYTADNYTNVYLASSADLIDSEWGCDGNSVPGTQGSAIGAGAQNTLDIIAACATADIAADRCGDFTDGSHSWFLPSIDELDALRLNLTLTTGTYWTSGEFGGGRGYSIDFSNGNVNSPTKGTTLKVRAATYISGN